MEKYVPITAYAGPEEQTQLLWDFSLPPSLDAERLVVNSRRLALMQRIGGISISVVQDYQGDRSEYIPGLAGINGDGTALATKSGTVKKTEMHKDSKIDLFESPLSARFGKVASQHLLNKAEIAAKVSGRVMKGQSREAAWAHELDENLRTSMLESSKLHLVGRTQPLSKPFYLFLTYNCADLVTSGPGIDSGMGFMLWTLPLAAEAAVNKLRYGDTRLRELRWSLIPYSEYQPDRAVAQSAVSKIPGLIKARA